MQEPDDLFAAACEMVFGRPEAAKLISEIGLYRRHGHAARRLMYPSSLPDLLTYSSRPGYLTIADRLEDISDEILELSRGASNAEMLESFASAARWLAYQHRKLALVDESARLLDAGCPTDAASNVARLQQDAETLAADWQRMWNRNRYTDDPSATPQALKAEAALFSVELDALTAAAEGGPYEGSLNTPIIVVDIINTNPGGPGLGVETSVDGSQFTTRMMCHIIQFDSRAAKPESHDEVTYAVPVDSVEDIHFIRVTAFGAGSFTLKNIRLHLGNRQWRVRSITSEGLVEDAENILSGGTAKMGHPDPKKLLYQLMASQHTGRVWGIEHGSVTVEMEEVV
jgi:hypothetical protein